MTNEAGWLTNRLKEAAAGPQPRLGAMYPGTKEFRTNNGQGSGIRQLRWALANQSNSSPPDAC
jgi:hypothetical protein